MSSIPSSKMKHAHVHHDDPHAEPLGSAHPESQHDAAPAEPAKAKAGATAHDPSFAERSKGAGDMARHLAEEAVEVVKERPKTFAAIGAAVLAGAAALVAGPAVAKAVKGDAPKAKAKPVARKKATAKK